MFTIANYPPTEQKTVTGTFSGLPFTGKLIGTIGACLRVQVANPHPNLPAGTTLTGLKNVLTFHPLDVNVTYTIQ